MQKHHEQYENCITSLQFLTLLLLHQAKVTATILLGHWEGQMWQPSLGTGPSWATSASDETTCYFTFLWQNLDLCVTSTTDRHTWFQSVSAGLPLSHAAPGLTDTSTHISSMRRCHPAVGKEAAFGYWGWVSCTTSHIISPLSRKKDWKSEEKDGFCEIKLSCGSRQSRVHPQQVYTETAQELAKTHLGMLQWSPGLEGRLQSSLRFAAQNIPIPSTTNSALSSHFKHTPNHSGFWLCCALAEGKTE